MENERLTVGDVGTVVGIMSVFLVSMGMSSIQPIIGKIPEAFPDAPAYLVDYIVSLPALPALLSGLVTGALVANGRLGYKAAAIIGTALFSLGGVLPVFSETFASILWGRAILGVGMGSLITLGNPLANMFFTGTAKEKVIGMGTGVCYLGRMIMQMLAGVLCDMNFWYSFLANLLGLVGLLGVLLFLKEPDGKQTPKGKSSRPALRSMSGRVFYLAAILAFASLNLMVIMMRYTSITAFADSSATVAAIVVSSYTVGGAIGGLVYGSLSKVFGRLTISFSCGLAAASTALFALSRTIPLMVLWMFLDGCSFTFMLSACMSSVARVVAPSLVAFATSILTGIMNVTVFFSASYVTLLSWFARGDAVTAILVSAILFVVLAIITAAIKPVPREEGA